MSNANTPDSVRLARVRPESDWTAAFCACSKQQPFPQNKVKLGRYAHNGHIITVALAYYYPSYYAVKINASKTLLLSPQSTKKRIAGMEYLGETEQAREGVMGIKASPAKGGNKK